MRAVNNHTPERRAMASEPMTETELKQFVYRALVGYRERDFSEMGNTDIHVVTESLVDNIVTEARATLAAREGVNNG